ncbi:pilus (MSHA type) biogenesis protein MshL [Azoarcus sp. L1K30]|uniref:pilus (MSHA type) biogenesis protein MshL n=1 Tax=Azoarcus sp. L1K30 TaxID=2820277 RepID=UPI00201275C5|nr:pilus (MSHA type) biogenesis protein MshL [Azoarcus sp. L1K30]
MENEEAPAPKSEMVAPDTHTSETDPALPTYSVSVSRVPVTELLMAIARDARLDIDIHPGTTGVVTMSAHEQPLRRLLARIARQTDIRFELEGTHLAVMPDTPFLRSYQVDYVNLDRGMNSAVATSTQIATSSSAMETQGASGNNASVTKIETQSLNHFWASLENNIRSILKEHARFIQQRRCEDLHRVSADAPGPPPASCAVPENGEFVMINRETGVLMVRATGAQQEQIGKFITQVQAAARRQVIIEATIVEVALSDGYRQGIDWTRLGGPAANMHPRSADVDASALSPTLTYLSGTLDIKLELLESFGTVKVLSSPRLSVLNNQTAMLKVVEEVVYFLVDASTTAYGDSDREKITATTTPQSVSVGMVMALTPQISADGKVTLNVRPTISSISGFRDDPNPSLGAIPNRVPQIRTREIESVLRLDSGEIAVLGGLIEDKLDTGSGRIPVLGAIPVLGELFTRREDSTKRTELVIFLRPLLIEQAAIGGDFARYRGSLPAQDFFSPAFSGRVRPVVDAATTAVGRP